MGTRITLKFETANFNPDDLRRAVAAIDEQEAGEGQGIAPENVSGWDVIQYVVLGHLNLINLTGKVDWESDGFPDLTRAITEGGGSLSRALDGVVLDEMELI